MTVRMPANYNLMTEDEKTYTTGVTAADVADIVSSGVSLVVGGLALFNWIVQLMGARRWYAANKSGNIGTDL